MRAHRSDLGFRDGNRGTHTSRTIMSAELGLPSRTLHNKEEAQAWLDEVRILVEDKVKEGPIVV